MAASPLHAEQLHDAFEVFNRQSGLLEESYRDLQNTVDALSRRLRREQSARLSELLKKERLGRRLSELLETLPGAILVIDGNGVIRQQNSQASALLSEPLIGCSWAEVVRREVHDDGSADGNIQLRDGRWLSLSRRRLRSEPGEVLLLADVTDSQRMSELRQRNERLTSIGKMTAEFAHQVRTPLASAMLYLDQLDRDTASGARAADRISAGLHELKRMVHDMLGFARGANCTQHTVNVATLFADVQRSIQEQLGAGSTLRIAVADESLTVEANEDALRGALLNLVTNADQAGDGTANILLHADRVKDAVHLCVTDDGPGVANDIRARLFDAFFTMRPQGTGLGLAVVKAVAEAHGGDAFLATSDLGASFTIRLPAGSRDRGES
ncbi:MAG: PAS domain-containing sensor histidine kinase [Woeseiaceae bacterium]|nr:PAS domain-containing sensor histidine kinase [Woeseiaceae bacterium]